MANKEIKIYTLKRKIGKYWYGEQICAASPKQAKRIAKKIGAKIDGTLVLERTACPKCGIVDRSAEELLRIREIDWVNKLDDQDDTD
jgi:hypothetical protein